MKIIIDLEATCWESKLDSRTGQNEIIEIGAVITDDHFETLGEFQSFVKPVRNPNLSEFCTNLTTITQKDVDGAPEFKVALGALIAYVQTTFGKQLSQIMFCSWGNYDANQFRKDCEYHGVPYPFGVHRNLKKDFAKEVGKKPCGMARAAEKAGVPITGAHHRGIDDARTITAIAKKTWGPVSKWRKS